MARHTPEATGRHPIPQVETGTGRHRTEADRGSLPSGTPLGTSEPKGPPQPTR